LSEFRLILRFWEATTAKQMKTDQYCQRQRCRPNHVDLEQFLACFRVAPVCQRQAGLSCCACIYARLSGVVVNGLALGPRTGFASVPCHCSTG